MVGHLGGQSAEVRIPRLDKAPRLEDFLTMTPSAEWAGKLAKVEGFIQRDPDDGQQATEATEVYLGYDAASLFAIFVAHDGQPQKIRGRLERRESGGGDEDAVGVYLDTFHDQRRAYEFACNPVGVQADDIRSEDSDSWDSSFDTVWDSQGKVTAGGYIVWMRIPFRSLRFEQTASQTWGILVWRYMSRRAEGSFWPAVSRNSRGYLGQESTAKGIENISPGRNLQLIPYARFRSFHAIDDRNPAVPVYEDRSAEVRAGGDAKIVIKDSLVLDLTARPDFSQVESDEPQTTVNRRFESFFPEKRPFFTENGSYFEAPMAGLEGNARLLFTRRIADPDFGARLTGRRGPYSVGALFADDKSPGETAAPADPAAGARAYFDVVRVSRGLGGQSSLGTMFTERRFLGSYNRVLDIDSILRLDKNWALTALGAYSWTRALDGQVAAGRDLDLRLTRQGRGFNYDLKYSARAPEFLTQTGFVPRNDLRYLMQLASYEVRPQHSWLTRIVPALYLERGWFFHGTNAFETINPAITVDFNHLTTLKVYWARFNDGWRPQDFPALTQPSTFHGERIMGLNLMSRNLKWATLSANYEWGPQLNYGILPGQAPGITRQGHLEAGLSVLRSRGLSVNNSYILDRSLRPADGRTLYSSHILRSKWSWQLTRKASVRFIAQYNAVLANPQLTSVPTKRDFNGDFLFTYLVHPGTALYVGYNGDLSRPGPAVGGAGPDRFVGDGRQLFVKVSYLFRF